MKRLMPVVLALLLTAPVALAEPLAPRIVPAAARWVLHVDMAALKASATGQVLLEAGLRDDVARQLDTAKALYSVDVREDIEGMTMFGTGDSPDAAVLVMTGRFDAERLTELVEALDGYTVDSQGERTVHSWLDQASGLRHYGVLVDAQTLMLSQDADRLREARDVRDGRTGDITQAADDGLNLEALTRPGTWLGVVADLRQLDLAGNPLLATAEGTEWFMLRMAESVTDGFSLSAEVRRQTPQQATELEQMLRGLLIMGALQFQQEAPELAQLLQAVQIRTAGRSLNLQLRYPADKLAALVQSSLDQAVQN